MNTQRLHETIHFGGASLIINPGTGPVDDATEAHARANMQALLADLALPGATFRRKRVDDYGKGRYCFVVAYGDLRKQVQMPGWALEQVRYLGAPQNIWDFPRLYVCDSSWVWCFALNALRRELLPEQESAAAP